MKDIFEDWEFLLRLIKDDDEVYRIPKVCFFYRIKEVSRNTASWTDKERRNKVLQYIYQKNHDLYNSADNNPLVAYQNLEDEVYFASQRVRSSLAYRIGNAMIRPFRYLRKMIRPTRLP